MADAAASSGDSGPSQRGGGPQQKRKRRSGPKSKSSPFVSVLPLVGGVGCSAEGWKGLWGCGPRSSSVPHTVGGQGGRCRAAPLSTLPHAPSSSPLPCLQVGVTQYK